MKNFFSLSRVYYWFIKGGTAVLDQGVFSGANFLLTILLARWLTSEQYGAYAIGLSTLIFFLQFLISFIIEPMTVLGVSSYREKIRIYLLSQIKIYFIVMGSIGIFFGIVLSLLRRFIYNFLIYDVLIVILFTLPLILLPWMLRRVFYLQNQPHISLLCSITYSIVLFLFIFIIKEIGILTSVSSVFAIALAGLATVLFPFFQLKKERSKTYITSILIKDLISENWEFGKWLVASGILITIASQSQIYLTAKFLELKDIGIVYALQTLSQPMTLSITAVSALITPSLAFDYAKSDFKSFKRKALIMTIVLVVLSILFEFSLFFFKTPLEQIVYGGKYSNYVSLIPIWGLCPLIASLFSGVQCSLQAAKYPQALFIASLLWVPISFGFGIMMIQFFGLWGIAFSTVFGYLVLGTTLFFLYWLWLVKPLKSLHV